MTTTFPESAAVGADVLGARPGADPATGAEAIELAFQADGDDPQVLSLSICAAYHLREALDAALEAPFWWEEVPDDEQVVVGIALQAVEAYADGDVVDLARHRSVRWDETWTGSARP